MKPMIIAIDTRCIIPNDFNFYERFLAHFKELFFNFLNDMVIEKGEEFVQSLSVVVLDHQVKVPFLQGSMRKLMEAVNRIELSIGEYEGDGYLNDLFMFVSEFVESKKSSEYRPSFYLFTTQAISYLYSDCIKFFEESEIAINYLYYNIDIDDTEFNNCVDTLKEYFFVNMINVPTDSYQLEKFFRQLMTKLRKKYSAEIYIGDTKIHIEYHETLFSYPQFECLDFCKCHNTKTVIKRHCSISQDNAVSYESLNVANTPIQILKEEVVLNDFLPLHCVSKVKLNSLSQDLLYGMNYKLLPEGFDEENTIRFQSLAKHLSETGLGLLVFSERDISTLSAGWMKKHFMIIPESSGKGLLMIKIATAEQIDVMNIPQIYNSPRARDIEKTLLQDLNKIETELYNPLDHYAGYHQNMTRLYLNPRSPPPKKNDRLVPFNDIVDLTTVERKDTPRKENSRTKQKKNTPKTQTKKNVRPALHRINLNQLFNKE